MGLAIAVRMISILNKAMHAKQIQLNTLSAYLENRASLMSSPNRANKVTTIMKATVAGWSTSLLKQFD